MRRVYSHFTAFAVLTLAIPASIVGCRREPATPPPLVVQISGTLGVPGLSAPVRIVRDTWGIPHIRAATQDDLFFAQGFVQAQDRLFQMDVWRRSAQGRLSQVLGPNFIERDAMTRRVQYRGALDVEWASYGADARAIAEAFVRGINAWVAVARANPPEEFIAAGWKPDFWSPIDLLNRTDAFLASGDAVAESRRAGLSDVIAETLGRVGAPPFFAGLAREVKVTGEGAGETGDPDQTVVRAITRASASAGGTLTVSDARRRFATPSPRYFVHLVAPGWNVIGATAPWLPGVALGHNAYVAWGMAPIDVDTQDIYVEQGRAGGSGANETIADAIVVKGRRVPFAFTTEITPHGIVIAVDREHDRAFALRWSGTTPGGAAELAALALDRARDWTDFRAALARWKMPPRRVIYADAAGNIAYQDAAGVPRKRGADWDGWLTLDQLPHAFNPSHAIDAVSSPADDRHASESRALFPHVLGITDAARRRFNVGPVDHRRGDDSAVQATFNVRDWDQSRAINAPGQSESPASVHFMDLARVWASGGDVPLAFSDAAVAAHASATLLIVPKSADRPRP